MSTDKSPVLLSRLKAIRKTSENQYLARCPSHEDSSPSLSIGLKDNGKILLHCFAGCAVEDVVKAVGLRMSDLMPDTARREIYQAQTQKHTISPTDALQLASHELTVAAVVVADLAKAASAGEVADPDTKNRFFACASRISKLCELATGHLTPEEIKAIRRNVVI